MYALLEEVKTALAEQNFERAQSALDRGADINTADEHGQSLLYWAVTEEGPDDAVARRVQWLLEHGARVASELPIRDSTSVHAAAERGCTSALRLLLAADGKCAMEAFDYISRTPLICAVHEGHLPAAQLLIEEGADVNAHDEARIGNSALSWAVQAKNEEMVKLLLSAGGDPALPGWMQLTALDRAAEWRESRNPELRRIHELLKRASGRTKAASRPPRRP